MKRVFKWVLVLGIASFILLCGAVGITIEQDRVKAEKAAVVENTRIASDPVSQSGIYNKVNDERQKGGISRLIDNPKLDDAALKKCADMNGDSYYAHDNPKSGKHGYVFATEALQNSRYVSENLNQGVFLTNQDFVNSWMGSEAHKSAILNPAFTDTGVAICEAKAFPDKTTMVQLFASFWSQAEIQAAQPVRSESKSSTSYCSTVPIKMYSVDSYGLPTSKVTSYSTVCK